MWRSALEPDEATLRAWIQDVAEVALRQLRGLETRAATGIMGRAAQELAARLSEPIAEQPHPGGLPHLLSVVERAADAALVTPGPGYLAYVPGGGLVSAGLADWLAAWLNRYLGLSAASPALARLEADALRFLAGEFGWGAGARGVFTTGGSTANLCAVVTARHHVLGDTGDYRRALVYVSHQVHHSVAKSVRLAGVPARNVVSLPTDTRLRLQPRALRARLDADRAEGAQPFLVVSSAGSINTGAVDPFDEIGDIAASAGLWHHVDGAYGGAFVLCAEGRERLAGISRADSITFDPHKGMFFPYGTGCLLVREGEHLRRAHSLSAEYLRDFEADAAGDHVPSPSDYGLELSRESRGLRVWLSLMLFGAQAFRDALTEKLELAEHFCERLAERIEQGLAAEIVQRPQLTTVAFRLRRRPSETLDAYNARNAAWLSAINARGRVFLSSTRLPGPDGMLLTLRVCILSLRTHQERVDACLEDLELTSREVA
ncbi:MAG: pyridoxal-dependent decarboxylase [Proteobacteria bacterium]|nr:pyridoxal-dependent decarboxylase [Pseudomonadota bacterium]